MNIAILHFHRLGGSGIIAYEVAKAMQLKGHQIHFVGLNPPFRMHDNNCEEFYFHRVSVEAYPVFDFQPYSLAMASQLSEIIIENDIDVIHSHYAIPHAMVALMARDISGRKVKCITTLHGTDITVVGSHPSMFHIAKYSIEKSDAVTSVSNYLKKRTVEQFGIEDSKIDMVYNFIDPTDFPTDLDFRSKTRKKLIDKDEIILVHSSNLREVKSPQDVITIFHHLVEKTKDTYGKKLRLWILGEGPLKASMSQMVKLYDLCEQVEFFGERISIDDYLKEGDFFIFPSLEESFGLAALEAMAWGMPVIARKVGGIPELIEDGVNGFFFEDDEKVAVDKVRMMIEDQSHYDKISQNAFQTVHDNFTLEKIIPHYEKLYFS